MFLSLSCCFIVDVFAGSIFSTERFHPLAALSNVIREAALRVFTKSMALISHRCEVCVACFHNFSLGFYLGLGCAGNFLLLTSLCN
mmetsp:Transcript_27657/g.51447  ORF Transcript_27657/g.51447 Transcript_27657/m.51447 type:complete len:86 (+) Transcript_27657:108-365(+)